MILKHAEQISSLDAERLKKAKNNIIILENLKDSEYLCKEADYYKWCDSSKPDMPLTPPIRIKLGVFEEPDFEIVNKEKEYGFRRTSKTENEPNSKIELVIGQTNNLPGITFSLEEYGCSYFCLGPFGTLANDLYHKKYETVYSTTCFFHNRRKLYKSIYNSLISNEDMFIKEFGGDFYRDFLSLFSVQDEEEDVPDFILSDVFMKENMFSNEQREKNSLLIQQSMFYPPGRTNSDWFSPDVRSEIYLNDENKIIIDSFMISGDSSWEHGNLSEVAENKNFQDFLFFQINELLKQTVSVANFGMKIYNKIKPRLLLENI